MQGIAAASFGRAVQAFGLPFVAPPLRLRDLGFNASVEMTGFQFLSITGRRRGLEPQINPNLRLGGRRDGGGLLDRHAQAPITHPILGETAGFEENLVEPLPLKHPPAVRLFKSNSLSHRLGPETDVRP
jgi:hypothetical protein